MIAKLEYVGTGTGNPIMSHEERMAKLEKDPHYIALQEADYHITEFYGGIRKYAEMRDARTMEIRDYSKKEYEALKAAGKTFKTDF